MRPPRNPILLLGNQCSDGRRAGRLRCDTLICGLGEVINLSGSGIRIKSSGRCSLKVGEVMGFNLTNRNVTVSLRGKVVWIKKTSFRTYDMGMEFVDVSDKTREKLTRIAADSVNSCQK